MKKLLYDIAPFYLSEGCIDELHAQKMIGTAVCAPESCITEILNEALSLLYNRFSGIVFIRADEETILKTANYLKTDYDYKQMKPTGFLSYKLPELSFPLNSENLPYIIDNFADFSSLEIHFAKRESVNFVYESVKNHPYKISAENLSDFITERYVILNKSGDADELECVVKEPYIQEILDIILKHFKSNKQTKSHSVTE